MYEPLAVSEKAVAEMLGISLSTVRRRRADLPCVMVGGRRLYPIDKLKAWLDARPAAQIRKAA